ncbi:MAG: sugar ABC transporter [Gammaproteobacteria bacterium]|nr:MAG: sugar ABC transporter [Gammaproteobacteria bacterium]
MKRLIICMLTSLGLFASPIWAKTVLLIESYHADYPWDASYVKGIEETFGGKYTLERFQMDTKRIPKDQFGKKAEEAWAKFQAVKPDLVMLGDDNALKFLGQRINDTGTPVVFLGINSNPRDAGVDKMKNVVGVLERPLFKRSISELDKVMKGQLKRMLVLFDSGTTSQAAVKEAFGGRSSMKVGKTQLDLKLIGNIDEWKQAVLDSQKNGYDALIIGLYHTITDAGGTHVPAGDVLKWTSENTPLPPFAFWDFAVGADKAAGGLVLFGESQGQAAAQIADQILRGTPVGSINPRFRIGEKGRFYFSRTQMQKWGLKLPAHLETRAVWVD